MRGRWPAVAAAAAGLTVMSWVPSARAATVYPPTGGKAYCFATAGDSCTFMPDGGSVSGYISTTNASWTIVDLTQKARYPDNPAYWQTASGSGPTIAGISYIPFNTYQLSVSGAPTSSGAASGGVLAGSLN
ncbi:MAG TPA: hypothetical protein VFD01_05310 [Candidatus Dormibacteraeota bacterium]|nr:hypothetical protein [Candidatus Dormibacteraeota bacterium]